MIVKPECVPCYLKQAHSTLKIAGIQEDKIVSILHKAAGAIPDFDVQATPAENSTLILKKIYEIMGNNDPYYDAKMQWNDYILERYDSLTKLVEKSEDRLLTAFKIAVAGNIIDMGITPDFDINIALKEITEKEFDHSDYREFLDRLESSKHILVVGDNSGEIVFDRILVEELKRKGYEVVYVVKDGPFSMMQPWRMPNV